MLGLLEYTFWNDFIKMIFLSVIHYLEIKKSYDKKQIFVHGLKEEGNHLKYL